MKKIYNIPEVEVIDLKARNLLDATIGAYSQTVPQTPGGESGGMAKPGTVISGGHIGEKHNFWDD